MANKKADNQWYGKGFERAIVKIKNNLSKENPYPEHIPALDWFKILKHAAIFISQYEERYGKIITIVWIGNKTNSADGDLIINGEIVEIKYTENNGNGTWFNTTLFNTKNRYGFLKTYKEYMIENHLYDVLVEHLGNKVSYENDSPVDQKLASDIKNNDTEWYKYYTKLEEKVRMKFTKDFFEYLKNNPQIENQFVIDAVTKGICNKRIPDKLVVFHYGKDTIQNIYTKNDLMNFYGDGKVSMTKRQKLGMYAGNIRIAIGWQNCGGLHNPTIRGFLK